MENCIFLGIGFSLSLLIALVAFVDEMGVLSERLAREFPPKGAS